MTSLDPAAIEAILFDLDGTLIDTDDQVVRSLARYLAPLARFFPFAPTALARRLVMWAETPGNALMTLFDMVGLDDNVFAIGDTLRRWRGLHSRQDLPLIPGADMVLQALSRHCHLAIVTVRGRRDVDAFLGQHNLVHLFDLIVTRESTRRLKPHPAPIRFAAEKLGLPPCRCAMVGDTTTDVRSARAANAWAVAVLSGFGQQDELERAGAHVVLESVAQMEKVLPLDNFP
ncbi:MAG: HAD family hydrolase [Anaerolineae bacterium]|jgi:phosphoglycolate phosphatase-like HAD superfamily hydrolase